MRIENRLFQGKAVDTVPEKWRAGFPHVLLVAPTGAGKTTIAGMVIDRTVKKGNRVLMLAHRRKLIQQIAERAGHLGIPYGVQMADLPDAPWVKKDITAPFQVASRDTLISRVMKNGWNGIGDFQLMIVDEAHRLESSQYEALANRCGVKHWLGLTATPCQPSGAGLGKRNWDVIVEAATVRELIALKYLVPVKCFAPPEVGALRKKGEKVGIAGDPVDHWKRFGEGRPTVVFNTKVEEAIAVRDRYRAAGITAEYLDASTPYDRREDVLGDVASGRIQVVTNVGILGEGVDLPALTVCQLLCRCESLQKFLQLAGRIMRPSPGKEYGILLDHSAAVFQHGFPDEPQNWELSEDDDIHARNDKERADGKRADPCVCRNCGCMFAGVPNCPECNTPTPRSKKKGKDNDLSQERLVPVGDSGEDWPLRDQQQRYWVSCLYTCAAKGWKVSRASSMFRTKFGAYPDRAGVEPRVSFEDGNLRVVDRFPRFATKRKAGV